MSGSHLRRENDTGFHLEFLSTSEEDKVIHEGVKIVKFNPLTASLYTDDNQLLKVLECPYNISWSNCTSTQNSDIRTCDICERQITDTGNFTDQQLRRLISEKPDACLKVELNQDNLRVISQGP